MKQVSFFMFACSLGVGLATQSGVVHAQNLSDQINAVSAAQERHDAQARAAWAAQQADILHQRNLEAARTEQARRQSAAAAAAKRAREEAHQARDEKYEDKLREMQLQSMQLDLDAKKTEVSRTNDVIDSELKQKEAETDLIHSHADVNRNISQGTKTLLEKEGSQAELEGQAAVKKESGLHLLH